MKENLCVVVVTHNRKLVLKQGLKALLGQSRPPSKILVVNNASTDGTAEMIAQDFPRVQLLELPENVGGAGGFHAGIEWAYEQGFHWISVMDDDGHPATDCLEKLLECNDVSLRARGPLVLDCLDPTQLAFKLYLQHGVITSRAEAEKVAVHGVIPGQINPFNGLVFSRDVVQQIGLPEKGLFLWGDEYEYFLRMRRAGVGLATIVEAHFFHPRDRMQFEHINLLVKKFPVYYANNPLKDYLILRNQAYIVRKYRGWLGWIAHLIRYLAFYWKISRFQNLSTVFVASLHGARSDFSHHKKFLP